MQSLLPSPQEAARELLKRRQARRSYRAFIEQVSDLKPARHHELLIGKLQEVAEGRTKRLMVFMPPGSAKSHYANVYFGPWYLGCHPEHGIITASYGQELADKWGRRSRNIVASPEYRRIFGFGIDATSSAANRWATEEGGEYLAVGVGGPVTGNRADLAIIDDPVKGREEADSETVRDKTREWYKSDLYTRLKPGAAIILIMTRWHEDDLAGWLLEEAKKGGEQWEVLSLPAIAEENDPLGRALGEPLWPEWFTDDMFAFAKRDVRNWSALYQQRPAPEEGAFFKREWFRWYDEQPKHLTIYGTSDYAVTDGGGDFTEHGIFGVDPDDNLYICDWWSGQTAADFWIEEQLNLIARHKPLGWFGESGPIRRAVEPFLVKRMRERKVYCRIEWLASIHDKPTRARAFQARASMGKVYLPRKDWANRLVDQLLRFPAGSQDDGVDVCGLIGRALDQTFAATAPRPKQPQRRDRWDRDDQPADNWKTI
jgi:predicted phage terminase large subunit-like protein